MFRCKFFNVLLFSLVFSGASLSYAQDLTSDIRGGLDSAVIQSENKDFSYKSNDLSPIDLENFDFSAIEGIGLYDRNHPDNLGNDLWDGSKRSAASALLKIMPAHSPDRVVQNLIKGVLFSETNARLLENDRSVKPGEDLLTLRLNKMIEGGFYNEAFQIYEGLEANKVYHPSLAKAGVLAMFYKGERSLACLEVNSLLPRFQNSDFFKAAKAFCDNDVYSFEARPVLRKILDDPLYRFIFTGAAFDRLSDLEQAVLSGGKLLNFKGFEDLILSGNFNILFSLIQNPDDPSFSQKHIAILLLHADQFEVQNRITLYSLATQYGFETSAQQSLLYNISEKSEDNDISDARKDIELLNLFRMLMDASEDLYV